MNERVKTRLRHDFLSGAYAWRETDNCEQLHINSTAIEGTQFFITATHDKKYKCERVVRRDKPQIYNPA